MILTVFTNEKPIKCRSHIDNVNTLCIVYSSSDGNVDQFCMSYETFSLVLWEAFKK